MCVCFGTSEPVPGASLLVKSRYVLISSCDIRKFTDQSLVVSEICEKKYMFVCLSESSMIVGEITRGFLVKPHYTNHRFRWLNQNMSRLSHHYCCLNPHLCLLNRHFRWLNNPLLLLTGWWFGTCFMFPFSWEFHHPN